MIAVNINRLRSPLNPRVIPEYARVLQFMDEHGHQGYSREISELQAHFDEMQAEAGPGGPDCPITQEILDQINSEIEAVAMSARERYDDWASD